MSQNEQLEQLEKQEKELEEKINQEKNSMLQLEKKKKVLQSMCDSLQMKKAEKLEQIKKLTENHKKMIQATQNDYKRKFQELDNLIGKYHEPEKKAQFKLKLVRERKKFIEDRWTIKESQYITQLSTLMEQINQLRSKINEYTKQRPETSDVFSPMARLSDDPLSAFIAADPIKSFSFSPDENWKTASIAGNYEKSQELSEKEDRAKTLAEDCRKLHQRKAMLTKQLKQTT